MDSKTLSFCIILIFCCWKNKICVLGIGCTVCGTGKSAYCTNYDFLPSSDSVERLEIDLKTLKSLENDTFNNYTNLKVVYVERNQIKDIPPTLFQNNPNLEEINLGFNKIEDIPLTLFSSNPSLKVVWLNNNQIKNISEKIFEKNRALSALIINDNQIRTFKVEFFEQIPNLKTLNVKNNCLKFFNPEFFTKIKRLRFFYTSGFSDCCAARNHLNDTIQWCKYIKPSGNRLCANEVKKYPPNEECGVRIIPKNRNEEYLGRVEFNDNGEWKTICDKQWTKEDADTVCRELGKNGSAEPLLPKYVADGNTQPILSNILDCEGYEYSTLQCVQITEEKNNCSHAQDVGVRCQLEGEQLCSGDVCSCNANDIDCSNKKLELIPWIKKGYGANIVKFDISVNKIRWIFVDILRTFSELRFLDFSSNDISEIPENLLSNSTALVKINFADNQICSVPQKLLYNLHLLEILNFASNCLTRLPRDLFRDTKNLKILILKGNQFGTLHPYFFKGLGNLESLDISDMATLGRTTWRPIVEVLVSLKNLSTSYFSDCCFVLLVKEVKCKDPGDTFSDCATMLKSETLRYFMWFIVVLTFGGNMGSLLMRLAEKEDNQVQNLFVSSLCVSDMLFGIYLAGIIHKEISTRGDYYRYDLEWRSSAACKAFGAISVISSEVSVLTLVYIAYDRFLHVVHALSFKKIGYRTAVIVLLVTWVTCITIAIVPAVVQSYFYDEIKGVGFYGTSSICLPLQLPGEDATAWEYCIAIFGVLNLVAATYLIVTYIRIFYSSYASASESGNVKRMNDHQKMAMRFAAVVFTDVCCWVPIALLLFLSLGRAVDDGDNKLYAWFSICVIPINSAINPILYTVGTPIFWRKIKSYFKKRSMQCRCNRGKNESNLLDRNLELTEYENQKSCVTTKTAV